MDQSLHARMGAEPTNGDGFGLGWYGAGEGPGVYAREGPARWLFASEEANVLHRLYPDNARLRRLGGGDRLIVSGPFADVPGPWREIPPSSAVIVRAGGELENVPFRPRPPGRRAASREVAGAADG